MYEDMTEEQLRARQAELTRQRNASTDKDEKKRLGDEIVAISDELVNRSLDAGRAARERIKGKASKLDEERTSTPTDAVSAGVRGVRHVADEVRRRTGQDDGQDGNG